jgi:hypothetical protein
VACKTRNSATQLPLNDALPSYTQPPQSAGRWEHSSVYHYNPPTVGSQHFPTARAIQAPHPTIHLRASLTRPAFLPETQMQACGILVNLNAL